MVGKICLWLEKEHIIYVQTAIWHKPNATDAGGPRLCSSFEVLVIGWYGQKGGHQYLNFKNSSYARHNFFQFHSEPYYKIDDAPVNIAQKPVKLMEDLLTKFCPANGFVLDFCGGSGSMSIACFNTRRPCLYLDKNKNMVIGALARLKNLISKLEEKSAKEAEGKKNIIPITLYIGVGLPSPK